MDNSSFVERALADINRKPQSEIASHFQHLEWILRQIEDLPSPEKEDILVRLILTSVTKKVEERPQSSL